MRTSTLVPSSLFAALAATAPQLSKAQASACIPLAVGHAPLRNMTSIKASIEDERYTSKALDAETPTGYLKSFHDLSASIVDPSYITMHTLTKYSPKACGAICDHTKECSAFNLYVIRNPTL